MQFKRLRSKHEIIVEILAFCNNGKGKLKNDIITHCNLTSSMYNLVNVLAEKGFLHRMELKRKVCGKKPHYEYYTAEKGKQLLRYWFNFEKILNGEAEK